MRKRHLRNRDLLRNHFNSRILVKVSLINLNSWGSAAILSNLSVVLLSPDRLVSECTRNSTFINRDSVWSDLNMRGKSWVRWNRNQLFARILIPFYWSQLNIHLTIKVKQTLIISWEDMNIAISMSIKILLMVLAARKCLKVLTKSQMKM